MTCRLCGSSQITAKGLCLGELALAAESRGMTASQFVHAAVVAALDAEQKRRGAA